MIALYRSLTRHRLYAILNIGGLALGIATFLVLFLFVRFETGYDRVLPGSDRLWVVQRTMAFPGVPTVPIPSRYDMLAQWRADYPGAIGTRLQGLGLSFHIGAVGGVEHAAAVDRNFFALFPYPVAAGDPTAALATPNGMVVTERLARKYFGSASPIGQTLDDYRIAAVLRDMPPGVTYGSDIFVPLPGATNDKSPRNITTFLRFDDPAIGALRRAQLGAFIARHPDPDIPAGGGAKVTQDLVPLASIHLAAPRDRATVAALGTVGLLALLVAIVNYINLATARADRRAREVAIRKVVGASRRSLILQFMVEAFTAVAVAALVGLALAELVLPFVNAAGGTSLAIHYAGRDSILPPLALLIALVAMIAGFYPAFVLSRFHPAAVLASIRAPGGERSGGRIRKGLVLVQFTVAGVLMIGTAVLVAQIRHLQTADLGFRRDGLILVFSFADISIDSPAQRDDMRRAFAAMPGVIATATSAIMPSGGAFGIAAMQREGVTTRGPMITEGNVGPGFFQTYGADLLAGRFLDTAHALDESGGDPKRVRNIVLNRTAIAALGYADPTAAIGRTLRIDGEGPATIVGVVADMRFRSPRDPVDAQAYFQRSTDLSPAVLAVRHTLADPAPLMDRMATTWRRISPGAIYYALTVDQRLYESFYKEDDQRSRLFTIGAVLAVAIGCIGLYGLAAFDTARRVKEVGIRKALGASTRDVLLLLIGQFLKPVLIASLLAWPIAFVVMRRWLSGFDDRVALSPLFFVGALIVAIGIAVATVFTQAWRVARAEPARALRYE